MDKLNDKFGNKSMEINDETYTNPNVAVKFIKH